MSKLKLEAGKFYRTRSGGKAKLLEQMGNIWIGAFYEAGSWRAYEWDLLGKYYSPAGQCGMDLISVWNDDDDWEDVDPTKITLAMLPIEARFKSRAICFGWHQAKLYGYMVFDTRATKYSSGATWWQFCQVRKGAL